MHIYPSNEKSGDPIPSESPEATTVPGTEQLPNEYELTEWKGSGRFKRLHKIVFRFANIQ